MEFRIVQHKNKEIHVLDLSGLTLGRDEEEAKAIMHSIGIDIRKRPKKSVRSLLCLENAAYNRDLVFSLKALAKEDTPYVIKTAVVGIDGLKKIIFNAVNKFSGRDAKIFYTRDQAMDWLVE